MVLALPAQKSVVADQRLDAVKASCNAPNQIR